MLRSLALCFAALSASCTPTECGSDPVVRGSDLEVRVVDEAGGSVAGIDVQLGSTPGGNRLPVRRAVSDADGIARFAGALAIVRYDRTRQYSAWLNRLATRSVRVDLDREHLDQGSAILILPPHGSIVLRLPAETPQRCWVRLTTTARARPGATLESMPVPVHQDLEPRAGCARCDFVELGLELRYEVREMEGFGDTAGRLVGPTRAGQVVTVEVPEPTPEPRVLARLLDEDGQPLARATIEWRYQLSTEFPGRAGCEFWGGEVAADEQGRISIPIRGALGDRSLTGVRAASRTVVLAFPDRHSAARENEVRYLRLEIPLFRSGQHLDLGERRLVRYGSALRYRELDDQTLERDFLHFEDTPFFSIGGDVHTEMLCEMLRRGGPEFERFVSGVLEGLAEHPRDSCEVEELLLRTAQNRLQGRPDPLTILREGPAEPELELPGSTEFVFQIRNDQPGNAWKLRASGEWPSPAFEIHDAHGDLVPQPLADRGSERARWSPLAPGESRELRLSSANLHLPGPGRYRVRVHVSPTVDLDRMGSLEGRISFASEEFTLHVRARSGP